METVDRAEIDRFQAVSDTWWDPDGPFKPLHAMNPVRLEFIRDHLAAHFSRDAKSVTPFEGLAILDVGCGGGLLSEPLTRLGAEVTAIDADDKALTAARAHAADMGLAIDYRNVPPEDLAADGVSFDVIIASEVVEHVADVDAFLKALADLVRPGGAVVMTTLNRTLKSLALAKVAAEYVLRLLPRGTHDWNKFLTPSELTRALARQGLEVRDAQGMVYRPVSDAWRLSDEELDVNYALFGVKAD